MKRLLNRDILLVIGLLAALAGLATYRAAMQPDQTVYPAGSTHGAQPDGTRALQLWLDELGYTTLTLEGGVFWPEETMDVLLVLAPSSMFDKLEVNTIDKWVKGGGTLIIAGGDFFPLTPLLDKFELKVEWLDQPVERLELAQPLLVTPPVRPARMSARAAWKLDHGDYVAHMEASGQPVLISLQRGLGRVFAITTLEPFTNAGLKDEGSASLVYNLVLAGAGRDGVVAFDEYHHGFRQTPSIEAWLTSSRAGWAILYSALVVFLFLLIGGRRFGAPTPLPEHIARRTTAEYIHALANLKRRAGRRSAVLAHYKDRLKRHLGRAYRVDPDLPDRPFMLELSAYRPGLDKERLARLLADLSRREVSERDMVRLAAEVDRWMG